MLGRIIETTLRILFVLRLVHPPHTMYNILSQFPFKNKLAILSHLQLFRFFFRKVTVFSH